MRKLKSRALFTQPSPPGTRYEASVAPGAYEAYQAMFFDPKHAGNDLGITEDEVAAIDTPSLIVHGREDRVVPAEVGWNMFNLMPNADTHLFARCGHWTQIERSADFNALLRQFLESSENGRSV